METSILNINNNYSPGPLIIEIFGKRAPSLLRGSKVKLVLRLALPLLFSFFFCKEIVRMFFHVCN